MEDLLYEAESVRRFVGLRSPARRDHHPELPPSPGAARTKGLLEEINAHLESQGLRLREGTIVDGIEDPSSTKNRAGERDPEMHQTKKGNQFRDEGALGVDSETGIVHSLSTTAANAHDVTEAHGLLHGGETQVWCDAGYQGVHKREENLGRGVDGRWRCVRGNAGNSGSPEALAERRKASVRAKVEHPFLKVKRVFGYAKVATGDWRRTGSVWRCFLAWVRRRRADWLAWAQWARIRTGAVAGPVKPATAPTERNGRAKTRGNGLQRRISGKFPR